MANPSRQAMLRVYTGPHAGAEVVLSEGANSVGSDDACDIVLADPQLGPRHAILSVASGVVTVEPSSGSVVFIDGQPAGKTTLRPYQFVTLGETHVAIGPTSEPWPTLTPPMLAKASEPEPAASEPEPVPVAAPADVVVVPVAPASPTRRRRGVFAVLAAAAALLAFLLLWNPFGRAPVLATQNNQAELKQQVETVLKKFTTGSDLKIDDKARSMTVTGYVPTAEVRKDLTTALSALPAAVRSTVTDTASLAEATGRVLKMYRLDFTAAPGGPGEVVVTGITKDLAAWKKTQERLKSDVPKIRTLTDRVVHPNQPKPVTPAPPPAAIVAAPGKEPAKEPEPMPVEEAPAVVPVADPAAPATTMSLNIRSVTVGQFRSLVLESGERVFEGASLPGGYVVKSISAAEVVLDKMGQRVTVSVGGSR